MAAGKNDWKTHNCGSSFWTNKIEFSPSRKKLAVDFMRYAELPAEEAKFETIKYNDFFEAYLSLPREDKRFDSHNPMPSGSTLHSVVFDDVKKEDVAKLLTVLTKIELLEHPVLSQADMQNALVALGADKATARKR